MEAYCNPTIDYTNLSDIIRLQKEETRNFIHKFLNVKTKNSYEELEKIMSKKQDKVSF